MVQELLQGAIRETPLLKTSFIKAQQALQEAQSALEQRLRIVEDLRAGLDRINANLNLFQREIVCAQSSAVREKGSQLHTPIP